MSISQEDIQVINLEFQNYHDIQNSLNARDNLMKESILKQDLLIKFQNDDLSHQLSMLENIESNISNKSRIIDQSNQNIKNNDTSIYVLSISIIFALLYTALVVAFGIKKIDHKKLVTGLIIVTVIYGLFLIYSYNILYLKTAFNYLEFTKKEKIANKLKEWNDNQTSSTSEALYGNESDWIAENCNCPADSGLTSTEWDSANNFTDITKGFFYYDGTAPQQLLIPNPVNTGIGMDPKYTSKIDWVDHSPNGNRKFYNNSNKIQTDDTQFYNYKNTTDPSVLLLKELNKSHVLVNDETYTANI